MFLLLEAELYEKSERRRKRERKGRFEYEGKIQRDIKRRKQDRETSM